MTESLHLSLCCTRLSPKRRDYIASTTVAAAVGLSSRKEIGCLERCVSSRLSMKVLGFVHAFDIISRERGCNRFSKRHSKKTILPKEWKKETENTWLSSLYFLHRVFQELFEISRRYFHTLCILIRQSLWMSSRISRGKSKSYWRNLDWKKIPNELCRLEQKGAKCSDHEKELVHEWFRIEIKILQFTSIGCIPSITLHSYCQITRSSSSTSSSNLTLV